MSQKKTENCVVVVVVVNWYLIKVKLCMSVTFIYEVCGVCSGRFFGGFNSAKTCDTDLTLNTVGKLFPSPQCWIAVHSTLPARLAFLQDVKT